MFRFRKLFSVFLLTVIIVLLFSGCTDDAVVKNKTDNSNQSSSGSKENDEECCSIKASETMNIGIKYEDSETYLKLNIPDDWELEEYDKGFIIKRNGKKIGTVGSESPSGLKSSKIVRTYDSGSLTVTYRLNTVETEAGDRQRRAFIYSYNRLNGYNYIYLDFEYAEIDDSFLYNLLNLAKAIRTGDGNIDNVKINNNGNKILLLGNSFINSSSIGNFLSDMLTNGKKPYSVEPISVGYANVSTFKDDYYIQMIKSGEYAAVYLCGFYSGTAAEDMKVIVDACDFSKTALVIFPAHNESESAISTAVNKWSDIPCVAWKSEIDDLINNKNISYDSFCINDEHKHSTSLAGYVGASMIYRSLFNEFPQELKYAPLTMDEVSSQLGDYVYEGLKIKEDEINVYIIR